MIHILSWHHFTFERRDHGLWSKKPPPHAIDLQNSFAFQTSGLYCPLSYLITGTGQMKAGHKETLCLRRTLTTPLVTKQNRALRHAHVERHCGLAVWRLSSASLEFSLWWPRDATFAQNGAVVCLLLAEEVEHLGFRFGVWTSLLLSHGVVCFCFFFFFIWASCPRTAALKPRDAVSWCCESDKRIPAETPRGAGETLKMKQGSQNTHTHWQLSFTLHLTH